jgi:hypothetical protein
MEDKLLKEALAAEELINLEFISKLPSDEKEE